MTASTRHVPVLRDRVIALLAPALQAPGAVLVDATLGLGGHAECALERFPELRVVGLDRDEDALRASGERLGAYGERMTLVHAVYDELPEVLDAVMKEDAFYRRAMPAIPILNDELDKALPPMGWHTWDDFVTGKPRDTELYNKQVKGETEANTAQEKTPT